MYQENPLFFYAGILLPHILESQSSLFCGSLNTWHKHIHEEANRMRISRIVKGRLAGHFEGERAIHNMHGAYQVVLVESGSCVLDGHEIGDLTLSPVLL